MMRLFKEHILSKFILVFVTVALLAPSAVKLLHSFAEHEHIVCNSYSSNHYHESDIECDFYKFKVSKIYAYLISNDSSVKNPGEHSFITSRYDFISNHLKLSFSLRGPPVLV
ncbi:MAG: hypothetical protein KJP09_05405 [Bacteroidia bacterium]|nr:hypothetical protein [Bacteroidia bacterium]